MNKFIHLVTVRFHNSKLLLKQCCNTDEKASSNKIKPLIFTFSLNETLQDIFLHPLHSRHALYMK